LGEAVQLLRTRAAPKQLRIAALPSVAQLWLSPRLPAIRSKAHDITISITAMEWPPNFKREAFDLSIFFEDLPGDPDALEICRDEIFPVCAPELAAGLKMPSDLSTLTCLQDAAWSDDWERWLSHACPGQAIDPRGPVFSLYSLALEEAKNGAGVLMGHRPLVQAELSSGCAIPDSS
jgi:LysR family glycine cleavage system transcriptional activator